MSGDSDVSDSEADELKTLELEIKPDFDDVFEKERKIDNSLASTISNGSSDVYNESETSKTEFYTAHDDIQEEKVKKIDPEKDLGYRSVGNLTRKPLFMIKISAKSHPIHSNEIPTKTSYHSRYQNRNQPRHLSTAQPMI